MADDVTSTNTGGTDATTRADRVPGLERACRAARIADEFRSRDVVVLDLTAITPIVDYFVVASGTSGRQMRAVADEISRVFKADGDKRLGIEGHDNNSKWTLIDFGDIVIHLQDAEVRSLYDLDNLWADAVRVDWQAVAAVAADPTDSTSTASSTGDLDPDPA